MSSLPQGFRAAAVACGVKKDPTKLDLTLLASDLPASAAGVFTTNRVAAAPVQISRGRVPAQSVRALVANSGNANACTGAQGLSDARRMTQLLAGLINCPEAAVLVCSTGIIGEPLPMGKIEAGIRRAFGSLAAGADTLEQAARGIMTTDTVPKFAIRELHVCGDVVRLAGLAKGAAMIGPNMATMLSFVLTDAAVPAQVLQAATRDAVDQSFNMISVEGHTSTNDTVLVLANAAAGTAPLQGEPLEQFRGQLADLCAELAQAIARDAEGAKHFVIIDVAGLRTSQEARRVAKTVAESPLVKTAIYGTDPNWGRLVSAAGYAGVDFAESDLSLWLNDTLLYQRGRPVPFDDAAVSARLRSGRTAHVRFQFTLGSAGCRFWTCDLTHDYITLNAEYHT